ncbi:MAG: citrate lyase acyl carrier protein [Oscillospiraceae bacterium]|nr:citrate lyase acyl carrier protein [Oscillospiraceae bacterium]
MKITKSSKAGTLESNDILIMVSPNDCGNSLELDSIVKLQFGDHIEKLILNKLKEMQVENVFIKAQDKGALDYTIISRVETAIKRAI